MREAQARRPTNVTIDPALVARAKEVGVNLSAAAERGIAAAVSERTSELWLQENREAIESSNAFVEAHGIPLAEYRNF